jgi:hypothetical protein
VATGRRAPEPSLVGPFWEVDVLVNARVTRPVIAAAIHGGLDYLSQTQRPSGEFATITGPSPDLTNGHPYPKSVYISTFVVHSLGYIPAEPAATRVRQGVGDFLEAEEEEDGTWNFDGRGQWRIPVDLDTSCCAVAALLDLQRRPPRDAYRLLWQVVRPNEAAPGGPYYTYVGVIGVEASEDLLSAEYAREVDPLVNANVLFCSGRLGIALPGTAKYLVGIVQAEEYAERSRYCISSHFPAYALGRAYADGNARDLRPAVPTMLTYLLTKLPTVEAEVSAFNLACRAVTLLNLGVDPAVVEPYLAALLRAQQADGGWPLWAAGAGFPLDWDPAWRERWPGGPASAETGWCAGSRALTTALALEALGKYLSRAGHGP